MLVDVTVRPARPADAPQAAALVYAAGPILYTLMFGPDPADVLRLFKTLFALPRNPFSYDRGLVALQNEQVVGLALAAPVAASGWAGLRMMFLLPRVRGLLPLLRRWRDLRDIGSCISTPTGNAYYLGILAVAEGARGRGIGTALIEEVHRRARMAGAAQVVLHAELTNADALRFYVRHGYAETQRHVGPPRLAQKGVAGLATLCRPV